MEKDLFTDEKDRSLLAAFAWWEKRRILYNIVVGLAGMGIFAFIPVQLTDSWIGVFFYACIANLFYCLGFLLEVAARHYFKSDMDFTERRKTIFVLGLVFSVAVTVGLVFLFGLTAAPHPD